MRKGTETIDRLFLELSQFTTAKTAREIELESALQIALRQWEGYYADHNSGDINAAKDSHTEGALYQQCADVLKLREKAK